MSLRKRLLAILKTPAMPFQIKGIRFIEDLNGRGIIGDDMGLGKTLQAAALLALHPEWWPALIVCPASLKLQWQAQLKQHVELQSQVLNGCTPTFQQCSGPINIINYDILEKWLASIMKNPPRLLILDEFQKIKNRAAKRSKVCLWLGKQTPYIIGLSGTPIRNRPIEFFNILHIIAPEVFDSYHAYGFRYCNPRRAFRGFGWDFSGASHLDELHTAVSKYMIRRSKEEVLPQLPQAMISVIPIALDNQKEYDHATEDFIEWYSEKMGTAAAKRAAKAEMVVQLGALKRLAAAGKSRSIVEWIKDWLEDTDQKLILFAVHHAIIDYFRGAFPDAVVVDGRVSLVHRQQAIDSFQEDPTCRIFIGQINAAGEGLNLQKASAVMFAELAWTPAEHAQAIDRMVRIGQTNTHLNVYYTIGKDTVEEDILNVLATKENIVSQIVDGHPTDIGESLEKIANQLLERTKHATKS